MKRLKFPKEEKTHISGVGGRGGVVICRLLLEQRALKTQLKGGAKTDKDMEFVDTMIPGETRQSLVYEEDATNAMGDIVRVLAK